MPKSRKIELKQLPEMSEEEDIYYYLLAKYKEALELLKLDDEEIDNKIAEFVQLACVFKKDREEIKNVEL